MTPETGSRLSSADASTAGGTFAVAPAHQPSASVSAAPPPPSHPAGAVPLTTHGRADTAQNANPAAFLGEGRVGGGPEVPGDRGRLGGGHHPLGEEDAGEAGRGVGPPGGAAAAFPAVAARHAGRRRPRIDSGGGDSHHQPPAAVLAEEPRVLRPVPRRRPVPQHL